MLEIDNNEQQLKLGRQYGKVYPLRWGYYSNPQSTYFQYEVCMFLFTLILTLTFSLLMINFVFLGFYHKIIGSCLCIYVVYRFVSLGLSSPGLAVESIDNEIQHQFTFNNQLDVLQSPSPRQQTQNNLNKRFHSFCNQCKIPILKSTKHCKTCKTCIDDYDHHCIWIGKCIGKKNMWQFKEFLCFVFVTLIYALILSMQASQIQKIT